jgi:hypothetical protein
MGRVDVPPRAAELGRKERAQSRLREAPSPFSTFGNISELLKGFQQRARLTIEQDGLRQ